MKDHDGFLRKLLNRITYRFCHLKTRISSLIPPQKNLLEMYKFLVNKTVILNFMKTYIVINVLKQMENLNAKGSKSLLLLLLSHFSHV